MKGKFFLHREIFESDVWDKPPYYLKIWLWILGRANYKTIKKGGKVYHRGEFITDYREIIDANKWKIGNRPVKLTNDQIFQVCDFLTKTLRIQRRKTTRGLWIKVLNYDYFQKLSGGESNGESNGESKAKAIADQQGKEKDREIQRNTSFKKESYIQILKEYQSLKRIKLQGEEIKPVLRAIKSMFLSGRTMEQILDCMHWCASEWPDKWTIFTVQRKLPEFVADKVAKDAWQYAQ